MKIQIEKLNNVYIYFSLYKTIKKIIQSRFTRRSHQGNRRLTTWTSGDDFLPLQAFGLLSLSGGSISTWYIRMDIVEMASV